VNVGGLLEEEPMVEYGTQMIRRKITIRSMERSELSEDSIEGLVAQLRVVSWGGPENHCTPVCWDFAFTNPMIEILQSGRGAQGILLAHMKDQSIQDQIVMLLGGMGDEESIWPIIETLTDGSEATIDRQAKRLNLIGNLALTNLTVSEVIWRWSGCGLSEALHKSLRFIPNPDEDTQAPKAHPYGMRPVERHRATLQLQLRIVSVFIMLFFCQ